MVQAKKKDSDHTTRKRSHRYCLHMLLGTVSRDISYSDDQAHKAFL